MRLIEREHLQFPPGTRWSDSNSGFFLAGLVIARASGARCRPVWHNGGSSGAAGELDIDPKLGIVVVDAVLNASNVP